MDVEELKRRIERKVDRLQHRAQANAAKFDGKEQQFTFHGGFTSGYTIARLSAFEEVLDMIDEIQTKEKHNE